MGNGGKVVILKSVFGGFTDYILHYFLVDDSKTFLSKETGRRGHLVNLLLRNLEDCLRAIEDRRKA